MDDLRMMQEVVQRWLKRQDEWPDLLLLDGGQTHLDAIKRTLEEAKVWGRFEVAALAKREETVFREGTTPSSSTVTDACWCMRETKRTASSTASIASVVDEARWRTRWNPLRASVQRNAGPPPPFWRSERHRARQPCRFANGPRHRKSAGRAPA